MKTKPVLIGIVYVVVLGILLSWNHLFPGENGVPIVVNPDTLAGIQTSTAPWQPELAYLHTRLVAIGLPGLAAEGTVLHIHQHLDLNINGNPVGVPAGIGINQIERFISPIHVHDSSGIIHVESNVVRNYTLGEFFDIWGVRFTVNCIGGYCADTSNTLKVYSNGTLVSGDPRDLVLAAHQEIMVVYGTSTPPVISSFAFPADY